MQEIMYVIALSVGSLFAMFILTKLIGYRQMSQMSMFDYVNGITIGSIAAEMATSLDENYIQPLTAMIVYGIFAIFISYISNKSIKVRKFVEGTPLILLNNGELYEKNLKKAKIDISEFLSQCRVSGYFDISKLETAILEGNGKISFLPKSTDRPITPSDMQLQPQQDFMVANVIIDGKIMKENLQHTGNNEKWLLSQIRGKGANSVKEVFLATCNQVNQLTVYLKENKKEDKDVLN